MRRRHPIFAMPFDGEVANALEAEYREQSLGRRLQARRKAWARDAMLVVTGRVRRHVAKAPATTRRMLWIYTWTTVGDAILDLAPRRLVPKDIAIDLLIAPALAPLFLTDRRLHAVHVDPAQCADDYDFVLLDSLRTSSLRLLAQRFARVPFATMRGHQAGERFDRAAFADKRLRQLFTLPPGPIEAPRLDFDPPAPRDATAVCRIALALGARVTRKLYPHWNDVVAALVAGWPPERPAPEFHLVGQGRPARRQATAITVPEPSRKVSLIDSGDLRKTALDIAACDAFLGVDGGLMHVAVAVGTPGLALFAGIDSRYFLRPESTMVALHSDGELDALAPADVAAAFLAALPRVSAGR